MNKIGIIKESRIDEERAPLAPYQIKELLENFPNLEIIIQSSENRCFKNEEYRNNGATISDDLKKCDLILGVKEIETDLLLSKKKYMFFSHTSKIQSDNSAAAQGTPGMDKKELLKEILRKKITLIDYENIRDNTSRRYLGFGRFAGIVGCYNSLNLYLETIEKQTLPRAYKLGSYEKLKEIIRSISFDKLRILVTGDGRVAKGSLELLKNTNIIELNSKEFLENNNSAAVFCNLTTSEYISNKKGLEFDLQHFIRYPEEYKSIISKYMNNIDVLISSHYWDPKSPKLFQKKDLKKYNNIRVIGDITCDINGSIPSTIKSTSIKDPYFYLDRMSFKETKKNPESLSIMAVDNLPSELPKESSIEFGEGIVREVIPYLIKKDDGRINRATITKNGNFMPTYSFLKRYINS